MNINNQWLSCCNSTAAIILKLTFTNYFVHTANSQGRERLNVTETKVPVPEQASPDDRDDSSDSSLDLDTLLDPHLRPGTPDLSDQRSQQIFEEHKEMAKEYLKVR